jgi:hypothetical protein
MAAIAVPRLMQNATDAESGGGLISYRPDIIQQ